MLAHGVVVRFNKVPANLLRTRIFLRTGRISLVGEMGTGSRHVGGHTVCKGGRVIGSHEALADD